MKINVSSSPVETARLLIEHIISIMKEKPDKVFNIAFSGGKTPAVMYELWANEYNTTTCWSNIRFWFVDERCVVPDDRESNYGLLYRLLLSKIQVEPGHIFRIKGENDPEKEAVRYSFLAETNLPHFMGYPIFDLVLLGVGDDGHTSSIFPGQEDLLTSVDPYVMSHHPETGQARIALTGQPIIFSDRIIFLVTGEKKATPVRKLLDGTDKTPSGYIADKSKNAELFIDQSLAETISLCH